MTTTTTTSPTIVLVHGAWHTPANYAPFITDLESRGFIVHCPHLPSCTNTSPPPATYQDDVTTVRNLVTGLVNNGERVLMILHSYGGAIGTDAVQGLDLPTRAAQNLPGGIIHLLYLCAYIQLPGRTVWDVIAEAGMTGFWPQFVQDHADGSTFPVDPVQLFLGDCDAEQIAAARPHLVRSPLSAFHTPGSGDAWRRLPVTYVTTTKDYSVPRVYQDIMLKHVAAQGVEVRVVEVDTAHSVFLSRRDDVMRVVDEAVRDERNP
ncbi:alpha/beta-hydrolase [Aspergillus japonicus CBS 114.51]|uniref:Alpha/beta-hydrolase n=1 Tax=Aspergillus japonicus CBS 114.51 TaxID=1448312 RepID=A0A8T8X0Q2_ASPJA|nr:alpha/beta-hydrolase [Aspergillus japonicus CBS 114.51]RAH81717.1 alpha/beta-hydrolase [Aspergillus japonicus CBS 114.51]